MSLLLIETKTKKYSEAYSELTKQISKMEAEIEKVKNKFIPDIKAGVHRIKAAGDDLYQSISDNKDLFVKPKTQVFHNIKVGYMKGKGKKEYDNDTTVKLIRKNFPEQIADTLIQVKETVISKAIEQLPASDLKKIGVNIVDAQDEVTIKPVDSEIKKVVDKIIGELNGTKDGDDIPVIVLGGKS